MNLKTSLAVAMIAATLSLTSCTVGNQNPPVANTGITSEPTPEATSTPELTATPEPTVTVETVVTDAAAAEVEIGSETPHGGGSVVDELPPLPDGPPVPAAELEGSRTAAHLRFIASRLDGVLAGGVPSDWGSGGAELDCWGHIAVIYSQAERDAWDEDIRSPYMCYPDGSYSLLGWSESGTDGSYKSFETGLTYVSGKGFVRD